MLSRSVDGLLAISKRRVASDSDDTRWIFGHPVTYESSVVAEYTDGSENVTVAVLEFDRDVHADSG